MDKHCIECGDPIRGRSDKKFCADSCRNAYHNRVNTDANNFVRNINNVLRRNRRILENACAQATRVVSRYQLARLGFDFRFFTHHIPEDEGNSVFYCYEFGYRQVDANSMSIVKDMPEPDYKGEVSMEELRRNSA